MVEKKKTLDKKVALDSGTCGDKLCPIHGTRKLKTHGRTFRGSVVKKLPGRVSIQFERMIKLPKYERYEKRKTKLHARLPKCMADKVNAGDLVQISETRPISKMIHFVVVEDSKSGGAAE